MTVLTGQTVVSSDHGQLLGERLFPIPIQHYGHPSNIHLPELVTVPWLIHEGTRREVSKDPPVDKETDVSSGYVEDRLKDLGYLDR
jgi:hypothetical protein